MTTSITPNDTISALASLQTFHADAVTGYEAALENAAPPVIPVLTRLIALHSRHSSELSTALLARGEKPNPSGSWFGLVHESLVTIRSLFGKLDKTLIPSLIDGEKRIREIYDSVDTPEYQLTPDERLIVRRQAAELDAEIARLVSISPAS